MSSQDIRAIAFDFGNTLCPWDEEQYWQVTNATLDHICALSDGHSTDSAYKVFSRLRDEESSRNLCRLVESDLIRILADTARELLGRPLDGSELDKLVNAHVAAFVGVCKAPPGLISMLDRLSQRYRLALLSNYPLPTCIRLSVESLQIGKYFESTIVSGDVGVIKPGRRMFREVLSALKLAPESVLFVGDDWIADVVGACAAGMPCVHILDSAATRKVKMMEGVFGAYLRKALALPELSCWREAKPVAVLNSVLELEKWLEEQGA
ncbi:MAG TPA: HAD-IA family hydrolase [Armatimonadota bacterium]|nr:HAD-IA family hydrolase [Armatimonadota bacterium]